MAKDINIQIQEAEQTPNNRIIPKKFMPRNSILNFRKQSTKRNSWKLPQENDAKLIREYQFKLQQVSHLNDGGQKEWDNIFQVMKEINSQSQILHSAKISFRNEGKINTFSVEWKLREFVFNQPTLKEGLKKVL